MINLNTPSSLVEGCDVVKGWRKITRRQIERARLAIFVCEDLFD